MARFDELQVRQLDEALEPLKALGRRSPPQRGWVRTIRESLGMSQRQVAARAGISTTGVRSAEQNEVKGTVQLDSLEKLAAAMDCELVYALVPRTSLKGFIASRAESIARNLVLRVAESMELEDQGTTDAELSRQIEETKQELLRNRNRRFWDD